MAAANFADPDFEPSDEQLMELSREAFANVRVENERALNALRERIKEQGRRRLAELHKK